MSSISPDPADSGKTSLNPLFFAMLTSGMGMAMMAGLMPMLGRELGLDQIVLSLPFTDASWQPKELAITMLTSFSALVFFFGAPFWGRRSDIIGRRRTILTGLISYGAGAFLSCGIFYLGLIDAVGGVALLGILFVFRMVHIFLFSAMQPAATAYVVDVARHGRRMKEMSRLAAANQFGTMIGPAFVWFVAISFLAPIYLQAMMVCIGAFIVWRTLPNTSAHLHPVLNRVRLRFFDRRFRLFLLMNLVIHTLISMIQQTMGFYFQDLLQVGRVEAAQLFAIGMICSAGATLFAQLAIVQNFTGGPMQLLKLGLPLCLCAFLLLANAGQVSSLYLALVMMGAGMGLSAPSIGVAATFTVENSEQGGLAGLMVSVAGLGYVLGPMLGGFIYSYDMTYPSWASAIIVLPLIVMAWPMQSPKQHVERS